jgi:protein-S-isoprenylcysteine O-methyltransferase Ste14
MVSWETWVRGGHLVVIVIIVCVLPLFIHLATHPALLRRRLRAFWRETDPVQRVIHPATLLCAAALVITSVITGDIGRAPSATGPVPIAVVLLGDLFVACGLLLAFLVFRANAFAAATVAVESEQTVVSTGPYAVVRHPLYSGAVLLLLGLPVALGSWWGLIPAVACVVVLIARLLREEKFLSENLKGYDEYRARVRHRLMPLVW